jgi:hypothetical protein
MIAGDLVLGLLPNKGSISSKFTVTFLITSFALEVVVLIFPPPPYAVEGLKLYLDSFEANYDYYLPLLVSLLSVAILGCTPLVVVILLTERV